MIKIGWPIFDTSWSFLAVFVKNVEMRWRFRRSKSGISGLGRCSSRLIAFAADIIRIFHAQIVKLKIGFSDPPFGRLLSGRNGRFAQHLAGQRRSGHLMMSGGCQSFSVGNGFRCRD